MYGDASINLSGSISAGDIGGDLTLVTEADQTISDAITLNGSGAALSITAEEGAILTVQAAFTTNA